MGLTKEHKNIKGVFGKTSFSRTIHMSLYAPLSPKIMIIYLYKTDCPQFMLSCERKKKSI